MQVKANCLITLVLKRHSKILVSKKQCYFQIIHSVYQFYYSLHMFSFLHLYSTDHQFILMAKCIREIWASLSQLVVLGLSTTFSCYGQGWPYFLSPCWVHSLLVSCKDQFCFACKFPFNLVWVLIQSPWDCFLFQGLSIQCIRSHEHSPSFCQRREVAGLPVVIACLFFLRFLYSLLNILCVNLVGFE